MQRSLLRAMHDGAITRVGGRGSVRINVRFVCSTRRPLEEIRQESLLDADILRHFTAWTIDIPPLRERAEDILPLAELFLRQQVQEQNKNVGSISTSAAQLLLSYAWPGNAHELKNCMVRAVQNCSGDAILSEHLPPSLQFTSSEQCKTLNFGDAVAAFEQGLLTEALRNAKGNMLEASRLLSASYRIVNYKVKKYGIDPRQHGEK